MSAAPLPVTVLTGYLGAGKTTPLNRLLSEAHGRKLAVIVNEFGEVGIDDALVVGADEEVVEFANGCLCCSFRGDLVDAVQALLLRRRDLDGLLIETTGLADPAPVAQSFFMTPMLRERVRLDGVVTVVDGAHLDRHLDTGPEARAQIAFADVLVLNKCDLLTPGELEALEQRLARLNGLARIERASHGDVPLEAVLEVAAFDPARAAASHPGFLDADTPLPSSAHEQGVGSVSLDEPVAVDPEDATMWLRFLTSRRGQDLYRMKGILAVADNPRRLVVQSVHSLFQAHADRFWRDDEERRCRLVFIGRDLDPDELRRGLLACAR